MELDFPHPQSAGYILKKMISDSGYFWLSYCFGFSDMNKGEVTNGRIVVFLNTHPLWGESVLASEHWCSSSGLEKEAHDLDDNEAFSNQVWIWHKYFAFHWAIIRISWGDRHGPRHCIQRGATDWYSTTESMCWTPSCPSPVNQLQLSM